MNPFERYIVFGGKATVQKLLGGGGGSAPSHLRLLFCKIGYIDNKGESNQLHIK